MPVLVEDAYDHFLLACEAEGLSGESVKWYRYALKPVVARFRGMMLNEVTTVMLRQYLTALRGQPGRYMDAEQRPEQIGGLSTETIRGRIRALSRFFNWSMSEYDLLHNPMARIRMPPRERQLPKAIDPADLRRLIASCGDNQEGARDRAILFFLTDTGCRAGGMLTLRPSDLHLHRRRAILREKGNRVRAVPFSSITAEVVARWLAVRPPDAETVFCSLGNSLSSFLYGEPMTVSGLNQVLKRLARRAGVTGRCNPHSFRHGFARSFLQSGGDLATVAQILGHSSIRVTGDFYSAWSDKELAERHDQFSPIKRLTNGEESESE